MHASVVDSPKEVVGLPALPGVTMLLSLEHSTSLRSSPATAHIYMYLQQCHSLLSPITLKHDSYTAIAFDFGHVPWFYKHTFIEEM